MTSNVQDKSEFRFTGKHMIACMVAFFGVIIAVNLTMAFKAKGTWTGLVVKNSYVASQQFNDELQAAKRQKNTGLRSTVSYQNGTLTFALKDKKNQPMMVENLVAEIGRPAFEQADRVQQFGPVSQNLYKLETTLEPGVWFLKLTGEVSQKPYRRDLRLWVDANGNGRLQ